MNLLGLKAKRTIIDPAFACYCFRSRSFREQILRIAKKSVNQASFSISDLNKIAIDVPDLQSQKRMVDILDQIVSIIQARQCQLNALDTLIKARFVEMFGDETNPYNWPIINVEDIATVTVGVVIKPAQYYTAAGHGVKAFRSLNIGEMYIKDKSPSSRTYSEYFPTSVIPA